MTLVAPTPTAAQYPINQDAPVGEYGVAASVSLVNAAPTREYVVAGHYSTSITENSARILGRTADEILRNLNNRTLDQMQVDAEIAKCIRILKTYTLSDGLEVSPTVSEQDKENYRIAKELSDFVQRALNNNSSSMRDVLEQMLDAMVYGHKVAEITYDFKETGQDAGFYLLRHLKVKSQKSIAFVVDKFKNVLGFKAAGIEADGSGKLKIIKRNKFFVLTFRGQDSDPRGTTILRAAYQAWHYKMLMWPEYLTWLKQCAIPGLVGITSESNDSKNFLREKNGELARDAQGNLIAIPATSDLANALAQIRNATAVAIPAGSQVQPINSNVSSEPFKTSRDVLNEEIEMCLLLQTLATSDSRHNTRAASQTAMTVLDVLVYDIKNIVYDAFRRDVVTRLLEVNQTALALKLGTTPDRIIELVPRVTGGDSERRAWATEGIAAADMYSKNFIKESQLPALYRQLAIEQPSPGDDPLNASAKAAQPATGSVESGTGPKV